MPTRILHVFADGLDARTGYVTRCRAILETQLADPLLEPSAVLLPLRARSSGPDGLPRDAVVSVPHPASLDAALPFADRLCRRIHRVRTLLGRLAGRALGVDGDTNGRAAAPGGGRGRSMARRVAATLWRLGAASVGRPLMALEHRLLLHRHERELVRIAGERRSEIVHGHSPHLVVRAAIRAAARVGVPVIYEVRGLWEETAVAEGGLAPASRAVARWRRLETAAMRDADAVVCLGEELRREILGRGVDPARVFVAPNGVDPRPLRAPPGGRSGGGRPEPDGGPPPDLTLGYVGSVRALEGLDVLVRGLAELRARGLGVRAIVVGEGGDLRRLRDLAGELGVADRVRFVGGVAPCEAPGYYRLIDVVVLPRRDLPVTRIVPPLKPLEAMAFGKPVVASDLPAVRELVTDGENGLLFRSGCVRHFAEQCARLIEDPPLRARLGASARRWVAAHRTWPQTLQPLTAAYAAARNGARRPAAPATGAEPS